MDRELERKRLVELLKHECDVDGRYDGEGNCPGCKYNGMEDCSLQELADHLLDNGIVVPPCKVGDKVWLISENGSYVYDTDVEIVFCDRDGCYIETIQNDVFTDDDFGKTVFTSREEAEKMLKGEEK